jgi:hypothetical protein
MYARALEDAEAQLAEVHRDEVHRLALSAAALSASFAATALFPPLVVPLLLGGLTVGALGIRSIWRQWDLLDRLADDRDAYLIPDVRAYAAREARMDRRRGHAALIRAWIERPSPTSDARVVDFAEELEELACELEDDDLDLEPACAMACRRLVADPTVSPLLNVTLPHQDVGSAVVRIRAGFRHRES